MSSGFGIGGSRRPSLRGRQWPPWSTGQLDDELHIVTTIVEGIKDPAKRAWQAGRLIELHTHLSDIRTEAVCELRERGWSWSEIAWHLGVSRGRAWKIGQQRKQPNPVTIA